jgi:DNA-binding NarL/FixJ family response regulator
MTDIYITDDHPAVVEGIRSLLFNEKKLHWRGHALTGNACRQFLLLHKIDILLLDINLPDVNGVDLCRELKEHYPAMIILCLSNLNEATYINKMIENGASGYVLKNAGKEELLEAIETVLNGQQYLSFDANLSIQKSEEEKLKQPVLSNREKEVLRLVAEGYTNAEIAEKLFLSPWTIDSHRKSLMAKLKTKNTAILIRFAIENNLI